jgi:predicted DNA-binding transcriptional regulator YafY
MNRKDRRRQALVALLNQRSQAISINDLRQALSQANDDRPPSRATLYDDLRWLREDHEAPIEVRSEQVRLTVRPWRLFDDLALGPYDLAALIAAQRVLISHGGSWFSEQLTGLERQLRRRLGQDFALDPDRIRVLRNRVRPVAENHFGVLVEALLKRRRLQARYFGRSRLDSTPRLLSPQRLVLYRSNWYLDAFDHGRDGLRTLAVERLDDIEIKTGEPALSLSAEALNEALAGGYGIFSGAAEHWAHVRFTGLAAEYAAEQHWHHEQRLWCELDRSLHLELPYSQPHELLQDILFWGAEAEILAPTSLRQAIRQRLKHMGELYRD